MLNKCINIMAPTHSSKYLPIFVTKTIDQGFSKILLKNVLLNKRANQHGLKESDRGSPKEHFYNKIGNWPNTFGGEDFSSFHYIYIRPNRPAPLRPCFSTNQHGLKESDRWSPYERFYKKNWKLAKHFRRRRFFKFSL